MANTLTGLIQTIYEALDIVSRELVGFIPAVNINASAERVAKDQTLRVPVVPAVSSATAITAGLYAPDSGDQTISYTDITIDSSYMVPIRWTGVEEKSLDGHYQPVMRDRIAQALRVLCNTIEADIAAKAYKASSRAYGTAGSAPFSSSLADAAQIKKILDDNGAPSTDRTLVINTTAGVNLRSLANLMTVNAAGTDRTLRNGILLPVAGLDIRESAQVQTHTKGTMTGSDCTAIEPVAETTVACDGSNSGTVLAGDIVTRGNEGSSAADSNKYVVYSGSTLTGNASGNFIINAPGLKLATAANDEWTIGNSYTANVAFHRDAIQLVQRLPELPSGGDMADDRVTITDPVSGLSFEFACYRQYRQVHYEVAISWGVAAIKSAHIATLLG